MEPEISFIDENGNEIFQNDIYSHTGLSNWILKNDDNLKKEYENSNIYDLTDFFVIKKGYLKVNRMYSKVVTYVGIMISDVQKTVLERLKNEGYMLDDLQINIEKIRSEGIDDDLTQ